MSKYIVSLFILLFLSNGASAGSRDTIRAVSTAQRLFGYTPGHASAKLAVDAPDKPKIYAALLLPQEYFTNGTADAEMVKWASDPEFNANMKFYAAWKRAELALPEDRRPDEATLKAWVKKIWDGGRTDIRQWEGDESVDYINTYAPTRTVGGAAAGAGRADADTEGSDEAESVGTGEDELTVLATPGLRTPVPAVVTPPSPTPEEIAAIAARDAAEAAEAAERTRQFELRLAEEARAFQAQREAEAREAAIRALEEEQRAAAIRIQAAGRGYNAKQLVKGLRREQTLAAAARAEEERLAEAARIEAARALEAEQAAARIAEEERLAAIARAEREREAATEEERLALVTKQRLQALLRDTTDRVAAMKSRMEAAEAAERAEAVKHWLQMKAALEGVTLTPKQISDMGEASKATKDPLTQFYVVANSSLSKLLANPADLFATTSVGVPSITYPVGTTPTVAQAQQVYARREQIIQSLWEKFRLNPEAAPNILRTSYFQNVITRAMFAWDREQSEIQSLVISLPWERLLFDSTIFKAGEGAKKAKDGAIAVASAGAGAEASEEVWDDMACLRAVRLMDLLSRVSGLSMDQISAIVAAGAQAHGRSAIEIEAIFNARALRDIIADPFDVFAPALDEKDKTTPKTAPLVRDTLEALERAERVMGWVRSHAAHKLIAPETMSAIEQAALQARGWTGVELATLLAQNDRDPDFFGEFVVKLYGSMLAPRDEGSSMGGAGEARSIKDIEKDTKEDESKGGAGGAAGGAGAETEKLVVTAIPVRDPREAADLAIALAESLDSARADHAVVDAVARAAEILSASGATSASPALPAPTGPALASNPDTDLAAAIAASLASPAQPVPSPAVAAVAVAAVASGGDEEDDPRAPEGFVGQAVGVMARVVNALTGGIFAAASAPAGPPTEEVPVSAVAQGATVNARGVADDHLPAPASPAGGGILPVLNETDRLGSGTNA